MYLQFAFFCKDLQLLRNNIHLCGLPFLKKVSLEKSMLKLGSSRFAQSKVGTVARIRFRPSIANQSKGLEAQ